MSFELLPKREWPTYMALSNLALVLAMGLGPVLGGAINIKGDWCWVFLFKYFPPLPLFLFLTSNEASIPPGIASIVLLHAYTRGWCGCVGPSAAVYLPSYNYATVSFKLETFIS
jgi:MFS family permease